MFFAVKKSQNIVSMADATTGKGKVKDNRTEKKKTSEKETH